MEKPREIPGATPAKNAPSETQVVEVMRRVEAIGWSWADACDAAGLGRATAFRLKNSKARASLQSLRRLEDWLVQQEAAAPRRSTGKEAPLAEWAKLGEELSELDPSEFQTMLDGLRDLVRATRQRREAILKMFRPTPDRSR